MAIIKGAVSAAKLEIDAATLAARTQLRPTDVSTLGSYSVFAVSGAMLAGLAGASYIFTCRWGDATRTLLVRRVSMSARVTGTAFTAGQFLFDMVALRSFSVSPTNQTAIVLTTNNQKRRTSFGASLITDLRIANTGAITGATFTADGNALAGIKGFVPATQVNYPMTNAGTFVPGASTVAGTSVPYALWSPDFGGEWPLVCVLNEGFGIRATVPATGTWEFDVQMEWSEVLSTAGFN